MDHESLISMVEQQVQKMTGRKAKEADTLCLIGEFVHLDSGDKHALFDCKVLSA